MCTTGTQETIDHLFFMCPYAQQCWNRIGFTWDNGMSLADRIQYGVNHHNIQFFMEASMIAACEIWKVRNDKIFN